MGSPRTGATYDTRSTPNAELVTIQVLVGWWPTMTTVTSPLPSEDPWKRGGAGGALLAGTRVASHGRHPPGRTRLVVGVTVGQPLLNRHTPPLSFSPMSSRSPIHRDRAISAPITRPPTSARPLGNGPPTRTGLERSSRQCRWPVARAGEVANVTDPAFGGTNRSSDRCALGLVRTKRGAGIRSGRHSSDGCVTYQPGRRLALLTLGGRVIDARDFGDVEQPC